MCGRPAAQNSRARGGEYSRVGRCFMSNSEGDVLNQPATSRIIAPPVYLKMPNKSVFAATANMPRAGNTGISRLSARSCWLHVYLLDSECSGRDHILFGCEAAPYTHEPAACGIDRPLFLSEASIFPFTLLDAVTWISGFVLLCTAVPLCGITTHTSTHEKYYPVTVRVMIGGGHFVVPDSTRFSHVIPAYRHPTNALTFGSAALATLRPFCYVFIGTAVRFQQRLFRDERALPLFCFNRNAALPGLNSFLPTSLCGPMIPGSLTFMMSEKVRPVR